MCEKKVWGLLRTRGEIWDQLQKAKEDMEREPSNRTRGYIDALEWVLLID